MEKTGALEVVPDERQADSNEPTSFNVLEALKVKLVFTVRLNQLTRCVRVRCVQVKVRSTRTCSYVIVLPRLPRLAMNSAALVYTSRLCSELPQRLIFDAAIPWVYLPSRGFLSLFASLIVSVKGTRSSTNTLGSSEDGRDRRFTLSPKSILTPITPSSAARATSVSFCGHHRSPPRFLLALHMTLLITRFAGATTVTDTYCKVNGFYPYSFGS
jgi:hypothetical protein